MRQRSWTVIGLVMVSACATVAKAAFASPVVTLKDVRLAAVWFEGGTLDVTLGVYNPNDFNLDASRITYSLLVDTALVGSGEAEARVVVPPLDSAVVRLPVRFTWQGVGAAGCAMMDRGAVDYRVRGEMRIASGVGTIMLPYDQRGRFGAPGAR